MAIQGISTPLDGGMAMSIRQANVQASRTGAEVTATKMYESMLHVSNAGNETNIGTSQFQKTNQELMEVSVENMAEIMQRDDDLMEVSNSGTQSYFSASDFQGTNDTSLSAQQQVAANAYKYFGS